MKIELLWPRSQFCAEKRLQVSSMLLRWKVWEGLTGAEAYVVLANQRWRAEECGCSGLVVGWNKIQSSGQNDNV